MARVYRDADEPVVTRPVETTEYAPVQERGAEHGMSVLARVIYLLGGILEGLLAIRFLLSLLGANPANAFANFIYTVTHPFVAPFFGLFNYTEQIGRSRFEFETLIAMAVYALITAVLVRLVTLGSRRPHAV